MFHILKLISYLDSNMTPVFFRIKGTTTVPYGVAGKFYTYSFPKYHRWVLVDKRARVRLNLLMI